MAESFNVGSGAAALSAPMLDAASRRHEWPGDRWARRHQSGLLLSLVAVGAAARVLLAVRSPTPYGYVFDFYHEAIQKLYSLGRLPTAADCWQCYHPPLLPILGLPLYALGRHFAADGAGLADPALRFVAPLALACGAVVAWYSYRILRLYRFRGVELVLGMGLILAFPCLFISSYGIEADILLSALMVAFLHSLLMFVHRRRSRDTPGAVRLGVLAGLACATKYTGVLAPVILILVVALRMVSVGNPRALARRSVLALAVCAGIGSWKYIDNLQHHQTLFFANGSAQQGFAVAGRPSFWRQYDFHSLRMRDLLRLTHGKVRAAHLTDLPFYDSVWTTLHAMAWSDMSLFSDPSRHGFYREPYPRKNISPALASTVLTLGLVPDGLAIVGLALTLRRRFLWPLSVMSAVTWGAYVAWFVAQESWALKTKYILFLLPAYIVYCLLGLRALRRLSPGAGGIAVLLLAVLVIVAQLYLLNFAWG